MSSKVLFVPSPLDPFDSHAYDGLTTVMAQHDYDPTTAFLNWNAMPWDWLQQLNAIYSEYDPSKTVLVGHRLGAMVAFLVAAIRNPSALWLFSLPPFFREDFMAAVPHKRKLDNMDPLVVGILRTISFYSNAPLVRCPTLLFIGSEESGASQHRTREAETLLPNARRIVAPGSAYVSITKPHSSYLACVNRSI
jgi:pimeloyl-ACP methyl ester carboxylesterase